MKTYTKIIFLLSTCFVLLFFNCIKDSSVYWNTLNFISHKSIYKKLGLAGLTYANTQFLIKTPGCSVPDYGKSLNFTSTKHLNGSCGPRAVFIKRIGNDKIAFQIDQKKLQTYLKKKRKINCCYRFGSIITGTSDFSYTRCVPFQNNKNVKLLEEVVKVTCTTRINKSSADVIYEDAYILVKKNNKTKNPNKMKLWNILVLGMSAMSRARVHETMPHTIQYLQTNKWFDYKGYHSISDNIVTNMLLLLTGKKMTTQNLNCVTELEKCKEMFLWHHFKKAGYITAFGGDNIGTTEGFSSNTFVHLSPDHHVWPYLHPKYKKRKGNLLCRNNVPSGKQLLDYAYQFVDTYKTSNFIGMFWINTFSIRVDTTPTLIDADFADFFANVNKTGALKNTFIIFLSDHGINSGDIKTEIESYYEKRLPMLFVWVPYDFRSLYSEEFTNMQINQNRLLSPFDVHSTMMDVLQLPNILHNSSEACQECTGIFRDKPLQRQCADAGVGNEWCTCHFFEEIDANDARLSKSINLLVAHIQNNITAIKTIPCMSCAKLHLKRVLRTHTYKDNNQKYYVIAMEMSPGDISYEATVVDNGKDLIISSPIASISRHSRGYCAIDPNDRIFCLCNVTVCDNNEVLSFYFTKYVPLRPVVSKLIQRPYY